MSEGILKISRVEILVRAVMVAAASLCWWSADRAPAAADGAWTQPEAVVETTGELGTAGIVGDSLGNLHVFFTHRPEQQMPTGIDYIRWDGRGWSLPVSVLVNPDSSDAALPQLVIDTADRLHTVWLDSNNGLLFSSSPAATAGSARSWSPPRVIAHAMPTPVGLATGPRDELYVAYSDAEQTGQISLMISTDGGNSWSLPVAVAQTAQDTIPGDVRIAVDATGRCHVTWTVYSLAQNNAALGVYYTRAGTDPVTQWEKPIQVAGPRHGMPGVFASGPNEVHLVWRSNIGGDGTFHQWSTDGGGSWSSPDVTSDRGGFSGLPFFASDSLGRVHFSIGSGFYSVFSDRRLEPYLDIITSDVRARSTVSDGEGTMLTITNGSVLHAIFHTDFKRVWYTSKTLASPVIRAPTALPAMGNEQGSAGLPPRSAVPTNVVPPTMAVATRAAPQPAAVEEGARLSEIELFAFAFAPATLLVVAVVLSQTLRRRP